MSAPVALAQPVVQKRPSPVGAKIFFPEQLPPWIPSLPSPDAVRETARQLKHPFALDRPRPVKFQSLRLIVKYGSEVSLAEAHCLMLVRKHLPTVPVPAVYAWCKDNNQSFIYMELIEGPTLEESWDELGDQERVSVCQELKTMVESWRELPQRVCGDTPFIGNVCREPLLDWVFIGSNSPPAGPFKTVSEFHDYYTHTFGAGAHRPYASRPPHPYRSTLPDDVPIVFTHADLHPSNIILSPESGTTGPRVAAIIDWQQSGWYPSYWEYCKTCWTAEIGSQWREQYIPLFLEKAECYDYWDYFVLARGM